MGNLCRYPCNFACKLELWGTTYYSSRTTKCSWARFGMYAVAVAVVFQETKQMKKVLLSLIVLATLAGAVTPAHAYRHCWVRHHHRHCRR